VLKSYADESYTIEFCKLDFTVLLGLKLNVITSIADHLDLFYCLSRT